MKINWEIERYCNYSCYYCYNTNIINQRNANVLSEFYIELFLEKIKQLSCNWYSFTLTGGEPTQCSKLTIILDKIDDVFKGKLKKINFITNVSKNVNYFKKFLKYRSDNFFIRLSFHPRFFNQNCLDVLNYLLENSINVKLSIIFDTKYRNKLTEIIMSVEKIRKKFPEVVIFEPSVRKIFGCNSIVYSREDLETIRNINISWNVNSVIVEGPKCFYNQYCVGGSLLVVNSDFTFSPSYCSLFPIKKIPIIFLTPKQIQEHLNNIVKCRKKECILPTNWDLVKFRSKQEALNSILEINNENINS